MKFTNLLVSACLVFLVLLPFCSAVQSGSDSGSIGVEEDKGMINIGVSPPRCGDNHLDRWEDCDGSVGGLTCSNLDSNWTGSLYCSSGCLWDTSQCSSVIVTPNPPADTSSSGGGGGGGGGLLLSTTISTSSSNSNSCVENWECTEWSNDNLCGTRTCTDKNNCETTNLKPVEELDCELVLGEGAVTKSFLSGITGAVTGVLGTAGTIGALIFLIALVGMSVFVSIKRRKQAK